MPYIVQPKSSAKCPVRQKKIYQRKGGVKGVLNNVKKTARLVNRCIPYSAVHALFPAYNGGSTPLQFLLVVFDEHLVQNMIHHPIAGALF